MQKQRSIRAASGAAVLLTLSIAFGQLTEPVAEDAQVVERLAPELSGVQLGGIERQGEEPDEIQPGVQAKGFRFEKDFNSDGLRDLVLLGSFTEDDARQSFVLVASRADSGQWTRSRLSTFDQEFIVAQVYEQSAERLAIFFCEECDHGGWIEWTGAEFEFRPYPPHGVR